MGSVIGPHSRIPAPKEKEPRAPAAHPKDGRLEEEEYLTPDTPDRGTSPPPPPGRPPAAFTAHKVSSQERARWGS